MKESEIQSILETVIQEGRFLEIIEDVNIIEERYKSFYDANSLPSFLIDYLSTKKAIIAARNVLQALEEVCVITTASKSISIDRTQRLFPDLILFNESRREIIVVEIKRSNKTARETLTEVLAYEHEIKNILPFLSNYEVNFCIISTDYTDLLEHSISGLITWESKQILCLQIEPSKSELKLKTHIPSAWTSTGNIIFPPKAISTFQIILYQESDEQIFADAQSAVFYAANLIAREADRNNSHGFALVWHDCWEGWENIAGAAKFHLTVGFVNPYVFLPFAQNIGIVDALKSPLGEYFIENSEDLAYAHLSSKEIWGKGIRYLEQYFRVNIEGLSWWNVERAKAYEVDYVLGTMRHRALPLHIELWGSLGDFAREFISHPGVKKLLLSGVSNRMINCEDPFIGIPILDTISGVHKLDTRGFTCKVLFDFGVSLGSILTLYNTAIHNPDKTLKNLPASITWYILDAQATLLEVAIRCSQSSSIVVSYPAIKVRTTDNFEDGLLSIQSFVEWMDNHFLTEKNQIHGICFHLGLKSHPLLDSCLLTGLSKPQREELENDVYNTSIYLLKSIAKACSTGNLCLSEEEEIDIMNTILQDYIGSNIHNFTDDKIFELIDSIPKSKHLQLYYINLMNLLDRVVQPVTHDNYPSVNLSDYKCTDWTWIREEMLQMFEKGIKFPAVQVDINGVLNILDCSKEYYIIPFKNNIDLKNNFPFIASYAGIKTIVIKKWKEVGL